MNSSRAGVSWGWVAWLAAATLAIGATVLLMLPAAWIAGPISRATQQRVTLDDAEGTLWSGSATLVIGARDGGIAPLNLPGRVAWHLDPLTLITGRISARIEHSEALSQPVTLEGTPSQLDVSGASATLPAGLLARLGPPLSTLGIDGVVELSWGPTRVGRGLAVGQGEVRIANVRSHLSNVAPLGSYRVAYDAQAENGTFTLSTDQGPLLLEGAGRWRGSGVSFHGRASAVPEYREQLADLLSILGKRQGDWIALNYGSP